MKLLILTQKIDINDSILGFFHEWIEEFAKHCEKVIVICLYKGEYSLPANVEVLSLGKEKYSHHSHVIRRLVSLYRFYKYIWRERKNYDAVFAHMNPIYVVLAGWFWRIANKKIVLWHTHRQVDFKLRIAEKFANLILTASKESCCLLSRKVKVFNHGIDIQKLKLVGQAQKNKEIFKIIYVGRISEIKNQEILIKAIAYLVNEECRKNIQVDLVGSPIYQADKEYSKKLEALVREKNLSSYINFIGSVPNKEIGKIYQQADLTVNLCPTGGVDKAVLESMACGAPALAFNKAFVDIFGEWKNELILEELNEKELAGKIVNIFRWDDKKRHRAAVDLAKIVLDKFSLDNLIANIIGEFEKL